MFVFRNESDLDEFEISGSTYEPIGDVFYGGKVKSISHDGFFFQREKVRGAVAIITEIYKNSCSRLIMAKPLKWGMLRLCTLIFQYDTHTNALKKW